MNELINSQKNRAVKEFVSLEAKLDTILFARGDMDDDSPWLKTGAYAAGGVGAGLGVAGLVKKGKRLNSMPVAEPALPGLEVPKATGFLSDLKTGTKAATGDLHEGVTALWKKMFGKVARAAV